MKVELQYVSPETLTEASYNPRRISPAALKRLARLLDEHGFVDPVVARSEDRLLLGGHQRIRANALRDHPDALIPCVLVSGVDDRRAKALNVALNNPAAQGRYDDAMLTPLLAELVGSDVNVPAATGFAAGELAAMTREVQRTAEALVSEAVAPPPEQVLIILEMSPDVYRSVRQRLDNLIAADGVICHVRMED